MMDVSVGPSFAQEGCPRDCSLAVKNPLKEAESDCSLPYEMTAFIGFWSPMQHVSPFNVNDALALISTPIA